MSAKAVAKDIGAKLLTAAIEHPEVVEEIGQAIGHILNAKDRLKAARAAQLAAYKAALRAPLPPRKPR